jgi:hypothetical protein
MTSEQRKTLEALATYKEAGSVESNSIIAALAEIDRLREQLDKIKKLFIKILMEFEG